MGGLSEGVEDGTGQERPELNLVALASCLPVASMKPLGLGKPRVFGRHLVQGRVDLHRGLCRMGVENHGRETRRP